MNDCASIFKNRLDSYIKSIVSSIFNFLGLKLKIFKNKFNYKTTIFSDTKLES